jgi:hypothetical protein
VFVVKNADASGVFLPPIAKEQKSLLADTGRANRFIAGLMKHRLRRARFDAINFDPEFQRDIPASKTNLRRWREGRWLNVGFVWRLAGRLSTQPFNLMLFRPVRRLWSKSGGPPLFEPPLKVEWDVGHIVLRVCPPGDYQRAMFSKDPSRSLSWRASAGADGAAVETARGPDPHQRPRRARWPRGTGLFRPLVA